MSKKHMGSSIDDFLKEEASLKRRKRRRSKSRRVATRRGHEQGKNLEEQNGDAAEDEPHAG